MTLLLKVEKGEYDGRKGWLVLTNDKQPVSEETSTPSLYTSVSKVIKNFRTKKEADLYVLLYKPLGVKP